MLMLALCANVLLGGLASDPNFSRFLDALNAMGLLSFGLYDYGELVNRGHGRTHDGLGLGFFGFLAPLIFWLLFLILTILANNIFIAVVGLANG